MTWLLAVFALSGALLAVLRKNPVESVVAQALSVVGVAGLLAAIDREGSGVFLAIAFGSALLVCGLTVLMFLDLPETELDEERVSRPGVVLALFLLAPVAALCGGALLEHARDGGTPTAEAAKDSLAVGVAIGDAWIWLFVVSAFLMFAAIIGATYLARRGEE